MKKEIEKDLKALAKKHNLLIAFECSYCGRHAENLGDLAAESYMVTLTENEFPNRKK